MFAAPAAPAQTRYKTRQCPIVKTNKEENLSLSIHGLNELFKHT
jgi:hypothetical protein